MSLMQAIVQDRYGTPEVLQLRTIDRPVPDDDQVLIRVHAASLNPFDWHTMTGVPFIARLGGGLRRPKNPVRGADVAGTIECVGRNVTQFKPGDEVFGAADGSLADFACGRPRSIAAKPDHLSFEQAASVPMAGLTALQALRDKGRVQPGQRVLVNGAAGGVGTFAVQIAKAFGADVTGVCSTANAEMVRSIGADRVIDYTLEDFTQLASGEAKFDVVIDNVGNRPLSACRSVMQPKGIYVIVSGPKTGRVLGPATRMLVAVATFAVVSQKAAPFLAKYSQDDLVVLSDFISAGKVTPVVERTYPLDQTAEALRYLGGGHVKGKLVIAI